MTEPVDLRYLDDPARRPLGEILRYQAELHPDAPFVLSDEVRWSYGEVESLADSLAAGLHELGVEVGDTVAIFAESCPELVPLAFGVNRLGAIWVPTNTDYKGAWLHQTLEDGDARVLVVDEGHLARAAQVLSGLQVEHVVVRGTPRVPLPRSVAVHDLNTMLESQGRAPTAPVHYGDTAAVLWTSGTTGRPKGVMQSHNAWVRAAISGAESSAMVGDDVLYCCLPLYNSAAWVSVVFRALVGGLPFGLDPKFSVVSFWDRVRHFGATQAFTLGTMHLFLWQAPERADDTANPVRCMGAIPMPDHLIEPFKKRFGIERIQQGYGQSEIMGLISRVDEPGVSWHPGSVGVPLPGVQVELHDDHDNEVPTGEVGEFCVRADEPYVLFNGYFRDSAATEEAFHNQWYHTGDLGRCDEDGQFYFVDRKKDYIRFKGRSVASTAVEAAVRAHPAVREVAAFGVAVEELDSEAEIMVAVILRDGARATPAELARFVNDHAPYFVVPRYIDFVEDLPLTPTGKVQKYQLRLRGVTPSTWDRDRAGFELRR